MFDTLLATTIFSIILALMLFFGVVKTVKFNFAPKPQESISDVRSLEKTQSEKAAELKEKNDQMMERLKAQMERNKR
jgi:hypothetical protein